MMRREHGYTMIEVLVVLLILGALLAIAIPTLFSQRGKAQDADAKLHARTALLAAETIGTESDGDYDGPQGVSVANLRGIEPTLNDANLSVEAVAADSYTVRVTSTTTHTFDVRRNPDGSRAFDCAPVGEGGCPSGGTWD